MNNVRVLLDSISRRRLTFAVYCFASVLGVIAAPDKPNVVFIISDDQAWSDYGFMGHPHIATPALDRLAAQSLTFRTRLYAGAALPAVAGEHRDRALSASARRHRQRSHAAGSGRQRHGGARRREIRALLRNHHRQLRAAAQPCSRSRRARLSWRCKPANGGRATRSRRPASRTR